MQPILSCAQSCARSLSEDGLSHTPAAADRPHNANLERRGGSRSFVRVYYATTEEQPTATVIANVLDSENAVVFR